MTTVSIAEVVLGAIALAIVLGAGLWALRFHDRQFPKDRERIEREKRGDAGWFATKFTWLSGGRG